ncbi:3'-5' exoribonuclease HELZ2 isoform X1 [Rattus norvegicus]|uniref:3'-5' exoribonuclease HELZ2 n=1 Tax=Rattus norvegicus TaxID=10116 RepID=A0A8I5ZPT9_RAT|nr:helicase with zinc finger domain 2 [Rattus norvegicus]XP_038960623.1 helicase with zinc finger domain 2 isoform X1 [Rattus norvegicus]|eukprot:NP_001292205.1 helicase with zinc finger domain 2 [Rattus norvegicus]
MASVGCGLRSTSTSTTNGLSLAELCAKVDLHLGCSRCTEYLNESTYILREVEHTCSREILLARFKQAAKNKVWRKVGLRPSFPIPVRYQVCRYYSPGLGCKRHWNRCTFASSPEEALVWTFELKNNLTRLKLKEAVQGTRAPDRLQTPADTIRAEFGGHFQLLCALCFKCRPPCLCPVDSRGHCPKHQICPTLLIHVIVEGQKRQFVEVRPLPQKRHPLNYCMFVGRGVPCRHGASRCGYAHSAVEMAVWKAEQLDGLQRGDLLTYPLFGEDKQKASHGQPPAVKLYCHACLVTCSSQEAFENHCSSLEHAQMVAFDQVVPRKHRAPPMGLSKFELCPRPDLCEYGEVCIKAHSKQELQEWVQRAQDMELREQAAWQDGLVPYQARLLAEYRRSSKEVLVMAETVHGVSVTCQQPLVHQAQEKIQHKWVFTIHSEDPLLHVALLKQEPGAAFSLVAPHLPPHQLYAQGKHFCVPNSPAQFQVGVLVQAASFGSFEQWVVFDFGRRPVLLQKLKLQLGQTHSLGLNGKPAPSHPQERECWHTGNRHVVLEVDWTPEQEALMAKYKLPSLALEFSHNVVVWGPISRTNYRQRMHKFLYEEEAAQQQLVAKLAMKGQVSLKTALETPALGMLFAPPGALYAEVPFPSSLLPDTDQGFLMSRAVSTALVAPAPAPDSKVYQVRLEARASSEHALWLLLPARCCMALGLQAQDSPVLEVQFQIDPLIFRFWHRAVDALPEVCLVVPDLPACTLPHPWPTPPSFRGNHKQKLAVGLIAGRRPEGSKHIPPLLIYGPFGTGKTYTLAMAALEVVQQPHTKVLICTHTNSAADIYVREYFHGYVNSGHQEAAPLRVMYADRPPRQTDSTTLQYCCLTEDRQAFRPPTFPELLRHRLVVTTTSQARELQVPAGFFSHIFIDEAAQMLECEALIPLSYALTLTRVVLAGDHMQVTPRLFSVPRDKAAGHMLLHRLFLYYQQEVHKIAQHSRIVFHENYRSTAAIINFVSRHFYVAKGNPIQASGKVPRHPQHYPLMFCHVAGSPEQDMSRTSWLNSAEVTQVVEKVQEIYNTWPHCWGPREQRHICAVSHGAQVSALRQELRRRNLGEVSVGSFEILPGREFRVVVLSSVHNRNSLLSPGAPTSEFFTEPRVLNTVMTRAQSQLVAVGDAVALCSSGACRKLWKNFIRECIEHHSIFPEDLSLEQIEQGVAQRQNWASLMLRAWDTEAEHKPTAQDLQRPIAEGTMVTVKAETRARAAATAQTEAVAAGGTARRNSASTDAAAEVSTLEGYEEDSESDLWPSDWELNADDAILKELLDESRQMTVTVREDGLLDTMVCPASSQKARQYINLPSSALRKYLRLDPKQYRRCSFLQETFERALATPLDDMASSPIQVRGRLNCGMAFTGDEVLVQILGPAVDDKSIPGSLLGRVMGVLKRRRRELAFVCRMDEWDPHIMIPINSSVTKIFVAGLKDPQQVPIHCLIEGKVKHVRHETLKREDRSTRLFWVRIVLWRERFYYPLGIVLEVLPKAVTWEQGLHILDLEHGLKAHTPDPASVSKALQKYHSEIDMAASHREDYRRFLTFTVDPQGACNLDDALSVRDLGPVYEVAVHIADVASLVPKDGALDVEARQQGTVFYAPSREPVLMLPASLCQEALSLLPGQDRLAISLFLTMEKGGGGQIRSLRFAPSIVRSDRQLSYEEAEELIKRHPGAGLKLPAHLDSVEACVVAACYFSWMLRRQRLPADCYYEPPDEDSVLGFRTAHIMVQEYMIQFNSRVAEFLVGDKHTQTLTPLRWQPTPSRQQLDSVFKKHRGLVPLSLHLCHHSNTHYTPNKRLYLLTSLWKQVQLAAGTRDYSQMVDLIATEDMHPSLAPACLDFRRALGRSVFGRSSQGRQRPAGHYSLQVDWYTWASSPIRRYLDVVLQRLILLALGHKSSTYSNRDIDGLCQDFSRQYACAQSYQRRACSLHLAIQLKTQPQNKLGFVVDVETGARCFKVLFPINRETLPDPCPIHYHSLQLAENPEELVGQTGLRLVWRRRTYSVQASKLPLPHLGTSFDPLTQTIDAALWMKLLVLLKEERWPEVAALIQEQDKLSRQREKAQVHQSRCGHFIEVAYELGSGDTLQVQLGSSLQRGFLAPTLQLWTVVPGFSLCLEHMERPGDCFSGHVHQPLQDQYLEVSQYSGVWGPRCALESLMSAVAENDSIVLQDVHIYWDTSQEQLQGTFQLEAAFLQEKCINIHFGCCYLCIRLEGLPLPLASSLPGPSDLGPFLNIDPNTYTWVAHGLSGDWDHELAGDWDQECVDDRQEVPKQVHFFIHHMTMEKVPEEVLRPSTRFTVEVLSKQLPDLRKEEAVRGLKNASPLVISIALGLPILEPHWPIPEPRHQISWPRHQISWPRHPISGPCLPVSGLCLPVSGLCHPIPEPCRRGWPPQHSSRKVPTSRFLERKNYNIPGGHHKLNQSQDKAVRSALQKQFTVIQGPPGTGKTVVGFHIVYWFHRSNQEQMPTGSSPSEEEKLGGPCVLYCGPSNKSVDVLGGLLLRKKTEMRPLRVYGEQAEATEFPLPGVSNRSLFGKISQEGRPNQSLRSITLHHRIRQAPNPYAAEIRKFDAQLREGKIFSKDDLLVYRRVLGKARKYELERHSVILCTCSCAASGSLKALNVRQILIDEAGMATEPETLIPLVCFSKTEKVVLLGDHKQLRPVVKNEQLRNLGMDRSLFERYHRDAIMLDTQYRMHKDICSFPSMEFYGGKLKTWSDLKRPPSLLGHVGKQSCPVIFGSVQGYEQKLLVSTEEGNENSRANPEEVTEVVRIIKQLTLDRTVDPKDVAVLTPYNAQAAAISRGLMQRGVTGVTVTSITKSQGSEWRYVIVSTVRTCPRSDMDQRPTKSWLKKFLGFVVDPHQVNVAITRAQEGLCIIGDHLLLRCCPLWHRLLGFCEAQNSLVPAERVRVQRKSALSS